jgi:hypothetical protein
MLEHQPSKFVGVVVVLIFLLIFYILLSAGKETTTLENKLCTAASL